MTLRETRAAELAAATQIVDGAKSAVRSLSTDEQNAVQAHIDTVTALDAQIKAADEGQARLHRLAALTPEAQADGGKSDDGPAPQARTLGEHFVHGRKDNLSGLYGKTGTVSAPEFHLGGAKAAGTTFTEGTAGVFETPVLTTFDRTIVQAYRPRVTIADLCGAGTLSGNAISYFVEGALEGAFTTVAEGGGKPQLHVVDPTIVTDALKKIAGFIKNTDEILQDLDFYVSEINQRLVYALSWFEEQQLLAGNGTGTNLLGIMNRPGVQSLGVSTTAKILNPDAIFAAMTSVFTASGVQPDGMVIHPIDYQALRLGKDANNQYYGGGYFQPQYGELGQSMGAQPNMWGLTTVVTPAMTAGTVLIGAFKEAATVYRKGGLRIEATNSNVDDFTNNLVTTRIEERVALAVRRPLAFAKLVLGTT